MPNVPLARRAGAWLTWWVLLMSCWVILDDSIDTDELLAGAGAAALGAFLAELAGYQAAARLRIRAGWLTQARALPGQIARDTVIVFAALWRRLAHGEEPSSGFRELPVRYGDDSTEGKSRRALLVGGRSIAPNTIVVDIDAARSVMVVHQLVVTEGQPGEATVTQPAVTGGEAGEKGGRMNSFVIAAIAMLAALVPCGIVVVRGRVMEAVVAYQAISGIIVMVLLLLAEGFHRPGEFELPVLLALLLFGSGLVFARFLERWL